MPKEQLEFDWDHTYQDLHEALYHSIHDVISKQQSGYRTLAQLAGDMGYDGPGLSKRLNPEAGGPKFGFGDLERFCDLTGNTEPIKYLAKKYLSKKKETLQEVVERVDVLLADLNKCMAVINSKK